MLVKRHELSEGTTCLKSIPPSTGASLYSSGLGRGVFDLCAASSGCLAEEGDGGFSWAIITSPDLMPTSDNTRVVSTKSNVFGGKPASSFSRDSAMPGKYYLVKFYRCKVAKGMKILHT